ncbi:MAG: acyl-CoA/acyl-ACP dehydrogenase [Myxococcota bacterium]|nr:acyl-CoA/acyl-ACP dehydrogenase [Myxococcota bacterium]
MNQPSPVPRNFGFGSEEEMLRDLARQFLDENMPVEKLRGLAAPDPEPIYDDGQLPGWDQQVWNQVIELGWPGLAVPEHLGGSDFSLVGIVGLVEEVGRHALPSPLISTLNASWVLRSAQTKEADPFLQSLASGTPASLAMTGSRGGVEPGEVDVEARSTPAGVCLDGVSFFVQDASKCELFLVFARQGEGLKLCVVPREAAGLRIEQDQIHDVTRDQATLYFEGVEVNSASVVSDSGLATLQRAWPGLLCLVSADLCGTSEWQLQTTVEYAKNRKQFERPIGFFQAVKHPLVDAMIEIDRARSLLYHAASLVDADHPDAELSARMAKSAASDAGAYISDRSVQLHGGIGFTWECDLHIFFKRSLHNQALYGDGVHQRRRLADFLVGPIDR